MEDYDGQNGYSDVDIDSAYLIDGKIMLRSGRDIWEDYRLVFSRLPYAECMHDQPFTKPERLYWSIYDHPYYRSSLAPYMDNL